ncbi:MAG: Crp/Fnr family transcriptional regulator [Halomonadaceae bacterium]|nr:MAG: Crp/Fnr family transcriptional regulator [Halomonadaceae bacterium]
MTELTGPLQNRLLNALSKDAQQRLFPKLKRVELSRGDIVYESGQIIDYVYFPVDAIFALIYIMINGASAEIAIVGKEGLVGVAVIMGSESTPNQFIVQSRGHAYRLPAQELKKEFSNHAEMRILTLRFAQALVTQMSQTAVCNRHHAIEQQLCRWLLLSLDRLDNNHLDITQESIASILGVRREGITEAAGKLQKLGVIEYRRGHITVLDHPKLESLSCECYAVVKRETDRLEAKPLT